jgi:DNA replication and repair protein RecF
MMSGANSMLVFRELRLRQFRNFIELERQFPPAGVAIIGENGSGKTNLLEAIYYLEIFRSFRGAPDDQLVRFGAEAFHVRGRFESDSVGSSQVTAAYEPRSHRKKITHNGVEPERIGDAIGQVGAVIFSPSDVDIVRGSPAERRRFLDIVLSLNRAGYLVALQRYRAVLRQRNAALRDTRSTASLAAWDESLVEAGTTIMHERANWVAEHCAAFAQRYAAIAHGAGADMQYQCGAGRRLEPAQLTARDRLAECFRAELARVADRERERGVTMAGPHRDELKFAAQTSNGSVDLHDYGSGGQVRTAAIALRMVEADTIRERRGRDPLILLDDVFAELDRPRSERILDLLENEQPGQVILTAPKESDLQLRHGALTRWQIANGEIRE